MCLVNGNEEPLAAKHSLRDFFFKHRRGQLEVAWGFHIGIPEGVGVR